MVNKDVEKLYQRRGYVFYSCVAKILLIMKRSHSDMELAINFLCTRVSKSDVDDWEKLKRELPFLRDAIDDERIIGSEQLGERFVWINRNHAVYPNMRGHTRGSMSFGIG